MDQIGKMYQNRAMVLQEEVNRLEHLLEAMVAAPPARARTTKPAEETTAEDRAQGTPGGIPGAPTVVDDAGSGFLNLPSNHPYWSTAIGAGIIKLQFPNRFRTAPDSAGSRFSAWQEGKIEVGKPQGGATRKDPRSYNLFDKYFYKKAGKKQKAIELAANNAAAKAAADAAAKAAADDAAAKAAAAQAQAQAQAAAAQAKAQAQAQAAAKDRFSNIKTGEIAAKIDETDPILRDQGTSLYDANGNIVQRGKLTPEGIDAVVKRQGTRYPDNPVTSKAIADMESGQMRRTAVTDLDSGVSLTPRGLRLGNGATTLEYPTMTGRQVAGKLAGKVLNTAGKFIDPVGEAASTGLGLLARAAGVGAEVVGGATMLPLAISLFDRQAGGQEQAGSAEGPPIYTQDDEDQARKYEQERIDREKSAMNPSGRFTPEPETQSERDDRARLGLSQPVAVDMRRIAAKNGTRRGEYSTLQDRPQQ
jgi:hypothetical protein